MPSGPTSHGFELYAPSGVVFRGVPSASSSLTLIHLSFRRVCLHMLRGSPCHRAPMATGSCLHDVCPYGSAR
jgi:hypothetical protein